MASPYTLFFSKINKTYFFVAFAIGLLIVYTSTPRPEVIMKFPNPYNSGRIVYPSVNSTGNSTDDSSCYTYQADVVPCPRDASKIKAQPV